MPSIPRPTFTAAEQVIATLLMSNLVPGQRNTGTNGRDTRVMEMEVSDEAIRRLGEVVDIQFETMRDPVRCTTRLRATVRTAPRYPTPFHELAGVLADRSRQSWEDLRAQAVNDRIRAEIQRRPLPTFEVGRVPRAPHIMPSLEAPHE